MNNSNVSVIIPTYNSAISLSRTIDSALSQVLKPYEVIVINDGSTDNTAEVAQSYGDKIIYIEQENQGQGAARNAGVRVATGHFIAFLDADDYWLPSFLEKTVAFLLAHPEVVAVSTAHIINKWAKQSVGPAGLLTPGMSYEDGYILDNFFDTWARHDHVRTGTVLMRRSVIEQAGPQLEIRISQDLEYWGYIATFGKWGFIPQPLWVGNSRQASRRQGWLAKYKKRRKLCPDVEQWGTRIEPRLKPCERRGYATVRGRVAMSYVQSKILAGAYKSAFEIVRQYGSTMPSCIMSQIMLAGDRFGQPGWFVACNVVRLIEWAKVFRLWLGLQG